MKISSAILYPFFATPQDSLSAPALFSELKMKDLASMGVVGGVGSDKRESKKEERRKKAAGGGSKGGGGGGSGGAGGRGGRESKTQKVGKRKTCICEF